MESGTRRWSTPAAPRASKWPRTHPPWARWTTEMTRSCLDGPARPPPSTRGNACERDRSGHRSCVRSASAVRRGNPSRAARLPITGALQIRTSGGRSSRRPAAGSVGRRPAAGTVGRQRRRLHSAPMTTHAATDSVAVAERAPLATDSTRPRIFSGIQPSGILHLGNDLGAIRNYVALQEQFDAIYCIVDYHALTSLHDPELLRRQTREMAASLLALGLDPDRCTLFVQSHRPEHAELAWLLCTVTPVSWVERTPSFKEKREARPDDVNHALLTYPVLQAADIAI